MGNTPTKDKQQQDAYAAYIQHQQDLILQMQVLLLQQDLLEI